MRYHQTRANFTGTCKRCQKLIWEGDIIYRFPSDGAFCKACGVTKCNFRRIWVPQLLVTLMLLWAFSPTNPFSYYTLLRWVCCSTFLFLSYYALMEEKHSLGWLLGLLAMLYNPIVPVGLSRQIWSMVNGITI